MAIIISDSFNRVNNPATMGNADTAQPWEPQVNTWGILSNAAYMNIVDVPFTPNQGYTVINAGSPNTISGVTFLNASATGGLGLLSQGHVFRWANDLWFWLVGYDRILNRFRLMQSRDGLLGIYSGDGNPSFNYDLQDGDRIEVHCCSHDVDVYLNDALIMNAFNVVDDITVTDGIYYGLESQASTALFDDFFVETNDICSPSLSPSVSASASPSTSLSASPSASIAPCTPPEGSIISAVNARGRLFITLVNQDNTQNAYAWHEGAVRMPISSMTNWKRSMRPLTLQELDIAFETDNADGLNPLVVSVHRNLRKPYVRDARVAAGSDRVDSLTAGFDSDNIGDCVAVFGHNIGGPGINYILGRISALASPSASPSPSSSASASPSTTESASPSGSPSASPSSSRSGSPSPSHSPSSSPSASPSRSRSASPSSSPSTSPSVSVSSSPSASPSAS